MHYQDKGLRPELLAPSGEAARDMSEAGTGRWPLPGSALRRRELLKAAGTLAAGAVALQLSPQVSEAASAFPQHFSILATGEALFVTFYSQAVAHHADLGIFGDALTALQAILAEEQLHFDFAVKNGGTPATTHFSFPHGKQTFQDRSLFLETQQLGEELTNGALLAWIYDFATINQPRISQIGGELMQVEGGHRVVGRVIMQANPWDNWGFGPHATQLQSFLDVPTVVKAAGFLSPVPGNDFIFQPVSPVFPGLINTTP